MASPPREGQIFASSVIPPALSEAEGTGDPGTLRLRSGGTAQPTIALHLFVSCYLFAAICYPAFGPFVLCSSRTRYTTTTIFTTNTTTRGHVARA